MVDDRELLFFNDAVRAGSGLQPRFVSHGAAQPRGVIMQLAKPDPVPAVPAAIALRCSRRIEMLLRPRFYIALTFLNWKVMRQVPGLLIVLFLAVSPSLVSAYSDRTFETERLALIKQIHQILISNKLCTDANDCTKKQFAFSAPESWGLHVSIYGIKDPVVLSEIVKQCALTMFNKEQMKKLEVKVFTISKAEHQSKSIFSWIDYTSIIFKE